MVAKIVDDLLLTGPPHLIPGLFAVIKDKFELGTVCHGPGQLRLFAINFIQHPAMSVSVDADDKLTGISQMAISCLRRRQQNSLPHLNSGQGLSFP